MDNNEVINDESFSLYSVIKYISENFIGMLLLLLAIIIIYTVDYISHINSLTFAMPSPIPGMPATANAIPIPKMNKSKKSKKH
jgi:hypothetical protein